MKKYLVVLILILPLLSFGQIQQIKEEKEVVIGEFKTFGLMQAQCVKRGENYTIFYWNKKYSEITDIKSFSFKDVDNAFENLYILIKDNLKMIPDDDIDLKLPGGTLTLEFSKIMGTNAVTFIFADNSGVLSYSSGFNLKQINKIFGK